MNPSRNNEGQNSNNQGNNFYQHNLNFLNTGQPYSDQRIDEDQDQYLLEDSVDEVSGQLFSNKKTFNPDSNLVLNNSMQNDQSIQYQGYKNPHNHYVQQIQQTSIHSSNQQKFLSSQYHNNQASLGFNQSYSNQQLSQAFPEQKTRFQNTNALSRASKLDQSLLLIFRQNEKQPENLHSSKAASKIEEKSKKAVSRLSHQFFGKSGNPEENMKSKKKTRQTVGSFGLDCKKDHLASKNQETSFENDKNTFQRSNMPQSQPQKMQIEEIHPNFESQQNVINSPLNQQKDSSILVAPQNRMSEVKKKRQRLSSGIEGLANLLKNFGSEKKEKKPASPSKSQPTTRQNSRVTMDMTSLISFLQSNENQISKPSGQTEKNSAPLTVPSQKQKQSKQRNNPPQISENIRHLSQYIKPSMRFSENIILEDQEEDQITPLKSPLRQKSIPCEPSIKKLDSVFAKQGQKSLQEFALESQRKMMANVAKDYYTRQVFNRYFCNLNQRIHKKQQQYEQLKRQKAQIVKQINLKLSEFTIDAQKLAQWKEQEHQIRQKIYAIKQKVNKSLFDRYSQLIYHFQLTFGIQLHRLQKTQLDDGFYIEFTYDDLLFRLHHSNKLKDTKCKFLQRLVFKKTKKDFEFRIQQKIDLIQFFINKKLKNIKNLTPFMIQLIRYLKALEKLELTMAHYAYINNSVKDFIFGEKSSQMEFTFTTGSKFDFVFSVDLIELLDGGGIKIYRASDGKNIQIPQQFFLFQDGINKIGKFFIFLEKYVAQSVITEVDNAAKTKLPF